MNDRIVTWADKFGRRSLRAHALQSPSFTGDITPPADGLDLSVTAYARVNHGRWIADCPFDGCRGAEYVDVDEPVFFCCECRNAPVQHHPVRVEIPAAKHRREIETVLLARPVASTRHWWPRESVADLKRENRDHGVTHVVD